MNKLNQSSEEISKVQCFEYLDKAAQDLSTADAKQDWHSGKAMNVAIFRAIADLLGAEGEARQQAFKAWKSAPGWFGSNASAARQAREAKRQGVESAIDRLLE